MQNPSDLATMVHPAVDSNASTAAHTAPALAIQKTDGNTSTAPTQNHPHTALQQLHRDAAVDQKRPTESSSSSGSHAVSPTTQDSGESPEFAETNDQDEAPEHRGNLQFKKKEFRKSRTQLFQLVLLSASLKSLKQQASVVPPPLKRNASTVSQSNTRNFQLFIQAPVLSLVTNLRGDDVEIGQRLPFDLPVPPLRLATEARGSRGERRNSLLDDNAWPDESAVNAENAETSGGDDCDDNDDDSYKEETTLQQQRLTLNALKKLSLSLAPIIRSDDDDQGPQSRQLTMKLLHSARPARDGRDLRDSKESKDSREARDRDLRPVLRSAVLRRMRPYQPAEVDLSSFSSLTRQSKHGAGGAGGASPDAAQVRADPQVGRPSQARVERAAHSQSQTPGPAVQSHPSTLVKGQTTMEEKDLMSRGSAESATTKTKNLTLSGTPVNSLTTMTGTPTLAFRGGPEIRTSAATRTAIPAAAPASSTMRNSTSASASGPGPGPGSSINSDSTHRHAGPNSGLMRPAQLTTSLRQRDPRSHASDMAHSHSVASSKLLGDKRLQQINGFRSPMYVPAVLRKTVDETPGLLPDTDHHGEHNPESSLSATSVRSVDLNRSFERSVSPSPRPQTGPYELNRRRYEYILRAAPTRKHWLRDETVVECGLAACRKKFSFFERRHHCRKCGGIFCKEHTSHFLYINHLAQFTTGGRGTLSRVCDRCIEEYNEFMQQEFGVTCHKPLSRESLPQRSALEKIDYRKEIFTPKMNGNIPVKLQEQADDTGGSEQLVGSVPANWSWSSF